MRLHGSILRRDSIPIDLADRFKHAHELYKSGALDEAAVALDDTVEVGLRSLNRLSDSKTWVTALVERSAVALARGEPERAQVLLGRLLRFDPSFEPTPAESSPDLLAALATARAQIGGRATPRAEDLGDVCGGVEVLLVARYLGGRSFDVTRLNRCRSATHQTFSMDASDESIATALLLVDGSSVADRPNPSRPRRWLPAAVTLFGVAAALLGVALAASVQGDYDRLAQQCGEGRCLPTLYEEPKAREIGGWAMVAGGGIVAAAGALWWILAPRTTEKRSSVRSLRSSAIQANF